MKMHVCSPSIQKAEARQEGCQKLKAIWVTSSSHFGHLVKLFASKQIGPEDVAQL